MFKHCKYEYTDSFYEKIRVAFAELKLLTFFHENISVFTIISFLKFNIMLTNEFVGSEQLDPDKPRDHSDFAPLTTTDADSIHFNVLQPVPYPCSHFRSSCGH